MRKVKLQLSPRILQKRPWTQEVKLQGGPSSLCRELQSNLAIRGGITLDGEIIVAPAQVLVRVGTCGCLGRA